MNNQRNLKCVGRQRMRARVNAVDLTVLHYSSRAQKNHEIFEIRIFGIRSTLNEQIFIMFDWAVVVKQLAFEMCLSTVSV